MRKGLKNLVAVAVALLGFNAMAMAPVISDIPSPIVGDFNGSTGTGVFVYEDALNLDAFVSDDFTPVGDIVWSYQTASGNRYRINGADELTGDPNAPVASENIMTTDTQGNDNLPNTITIEDIIGATDVGAEFEASDVVTLFASDITTYSSKQVVFYTDAGGEDRLSSSVIEVANITFDNTTNWTPYFFAATDPTSIDNTNGLCFTVAAGDDAFAGWQSPASAPYELIDNNLYVIRMNMNTTSALEDQPIVAFTLNNTAGATDNGFAYGGQEFFVSQQGNANSVATLSGDYRLYYAPPQVGVAGWRSASGGAFDAANAALKDFRLEYNLFSVNGQSALGSLTDNGTICMSNINIGRVDISSLGVAAADVYAESNLTATTFGATAALDIIGSAAFSYSGGNAVYTPANAELTVHDIGPGDTTFTDTGAGATDNFPVAWNAAELYMVNWSVTQGAGQPNDAIQLVVGQPTVENFTTAYVASASNALGAAGLPVPGGTATTLVQFYYTHGGTATTGGFAPAWRPVMQIANRQDLGVAQATSTLTINGIDVDQINLP